MSYGLRSSLCLFMAPHEGMRHKAIARTDAGQLEWKTKNKHSRPFHLQWSPIVLSYCRVSLAFPIVAVLLFLANINVSLYI